MIFLPADVAGKIFNPLFLQYVHADDGERKDLRFSGTKVLTFQSERLENKDNFSNRNEERNFFSQELKFNLAGELAPDVRADIIYDDTLADEKFRKLFLEGKFDEYRGMFGDVSLESKRRMFCLESPRMKGLLLEKRSGESREDEPAHFGAIVARIDSKPVKEEIRGSDSKGPYMLGHSKILRDSEKVEIDGKFLTRNMDYTVDFEEGFILFDDTLPFGKIAIITYEYRCSPEEKGGYLYGVDGTVTEGNNDLSLMVLRCGALDEKGKEYSLAQYDRMPSKIPATSENNGPAAISDTSRTLVDLRQKLKIDKYTEASLELARSEEKSSENSGVEGINPSDTAAGFSCLHSRGHFSSFCMARRLGSSFRPIQAVNLSSRNDSEILFSYRPPGFGASLKLKSEEKGSDEAVSGIFSMNKDGLNFEHGRETADIADISSTDIKIDKEFGIFETRSRYYKRDENRGEHLLLDSDFFDALVKVPVTEKITARTGSRLSRRRSAENGERDLAIYLAGASFMATDRLGLDAECRVDKLKSTLSGNMVDERGDITTLRTGADYRFSAKFSSKAEVEVGRDNIRGNIDGMSVTGRRFTFKYRPARYLSVVNSFSIERPLTVSRYSEMNSPPSHVSGRCSGMSPLLSDSRKVSSIAGGDERKESKRSEMRTIFGPVRGLELSLGCTYEENQEQSGTGASFSLGYRPANRFKLNNNFSLRDCGEEKEFGSGIEASYNLTEDITTSISFESLSNLGRASLNSDRLSAKLRLIARI